MSASNASDRPRSHGDGGPPTATSPASGARSPAAEPTPETGRFPRLPGPGQMPGTLGARAEPRSKGCMNGPGSSRRWRPGGPDQPRHAGDGTPHRDPHRLAPRRVGRLHRERRRPGEPRLARRAVRRGVAPAPPRGLRHRDLHRRDERAAGAWRRRRNAPGVRGAPHRRRRPRHPHRHPRPRTDPAPGRQRDAPDRARRQADADAEREPARRTPRGAGHARGDGARAPRRPGVGERRRRPRRPRLAPHRHRRRHPAAAHGRLVRPGRDHRPS